MNKGHALRLTTLLLFLAVLLATPEVSFGQQIGFPSQYCSAPQYWCYGSSQVDLYDTDSFGNPTARYCARVDRLCDVRGSQTGYTCDNPYCRPNNLPSQIYILSSEDGCIMSGSACVEKPVKINPREQLNCCLGGSSGGNNGGGDDDDDDQLQPTSTPGRPSASGWNVPPIVTWQARDVDPNLEAITISARLVNYTPHYTYQIEVFTPQNQIFHTYVLDPTQDIVNGVLSFTPQRAAILDGEKSLCYNRQPCFGATLGRFATNPQDALGEWHADVYLVLSNTSQRLEKVITLRWQVLAAVPLEP